MAYMNDPQGNPSAMRLMSMLSLVCAIGLAIVEVMGWGDQQGKSELVLYFLAAAFAPKAVQKFAEQRTGPAGK
ncbi:MAG: hypothetical protein F4X17_16420 [Gemmatimonadetes bacterium]|nr:hypothetical protein [Gemmatimonadota bacterium]